MNETIETVQLAEKGASKLIELGAVGFVCLCLMGFIIYLHKSHRQERKEWQQQARNDNKERDETYTKIFNRNNEVSDNLAKAIGELSKDIYRNNNNNSSS